MLNLGDIGFLVLCGGIIGLCYYYMVVRKDQSNLEIAKNIVNEDEQILVDQPRNHQEPNQPATSVSKTKSNLTSKQEAKRQARKEEKRRQREV